jgi:hypothetical protein
MRRIKGRRFGLRGSKIFMLRNAHLTLLSV